MSPATLLTTALALGAVHALVGVAVVGVTRATRTLHLAVGPIIVVAAVVQVAGQALGAGVWLAVAASAGAAALLSVALEPLVLRPLGDVTERLVGLLVAGAVLELAVGRVAGGGTRRLPPLVGDDPLVAAVALGLPLALGFAAWQQAGTWGRRVRLVGGSEDAASQVGVSPAAVRTGALAVAGVAAAVAAALIGPIAFLGLGQGLPLTVRGVAAAALLGRTTPARAVAGGLLLGLVEAVASALLPGTAVDLAVAVAVIAILVAIPPERSRGWGRAW